MSGGAAKTLHRAKQRYHIRVLPAVLVDGSGDVHYDTVGGGLRSHSLIDRLRGDQHIILHRAVGLTVAGDEPSVGIKGGDLVDILAHRGGCQIRVEAVLCLERLLRGGGAAAPFQRCDNLHVTGAQVAEVAQIHQRIVDLVAQGCQVQFIDAVRLLRQHGVHAVIQKKVAEQADCCRAQH